MQPYLSPLAEAEIRQLEADSVKLSAADIARLNVLGHRVQNPARVQALSRGLPVSVGGCYLWPVTLYGADWFQRWVGEFRGNRDQVRVLAYAMAHGRATMPEEASDVREAVLSWAKRLTCRQAELEAAVQRLIDRNEEIDNGKATSQQGVGAGDISAMLSAMTGIKPEVWEYQCSMAYALNMLDVLAAQNAADGKSMKHDEGVRALRALGLAAWRMKQRVVKNGD
jgi:hypothetical protein